MAVMSPSGAAWAMAILLGLRFAFGSSPAKTIEKEEGPDEVELFPDAERPEVLERPHQAEGVIMKKEECTDDVELEYWQPACPAQEQKKPDIDVDRRQNAHGPTKAKAAQANGAALFAFTKQKTGDEIPADDEEDEHAGGATEDAHPKEGNRGGDFEALEAVESENEKDGERPKAIETWNAMHRGFTLPGGLCRHESGSLADYSVAKSGVLI